ncbi:MAG: nucleotidyltransferase domain-containing protein [Desulfobacteraceae bacterium]|nr:nucleotidyltransferase domain-containing protein [Desulfobacteraceae bacterium]
MALSKNQLKEVIDGFIAKLKQEIPVREVVLFGSYADDKAKDYSDIDLAVISEWFEDKPRIENMQYLSKVAAKYNSLIEALPFTEREYKALDQRSFLASILRTGKPWQG